MDTGMFGMGLWFLTEGLNRVTSIPNFIHETSPNFYELQNIKEDPSLPKPSVKSFSPNFYELQNIAKNIENFLRDPVSHFYVTFQVRFGIPTKNRKEGQCFIPQKPIPNYILPNVPTLKSDLESLIIQQKDGYLSIVVKKCLSKVLFFNNASKASYERYQL